MSVVSNGILRMPTECWSGDALDVAQRHSTYCEAADRIDELTATLSRARLFIKTLKVPQYPGDVAMLLLKAVPLLDAMDQALGDS